MADAARGTRNKRRAALGEITNVSKSLINLTGITTKEDVTIVRLCR